MSSPGIVCFVPNSNCIGRIVAYARGPICFCLLLTSLVSSAQRNCDTTAHSGGDFFRIFGGTAETWQNCGDTLIVRNTVVIYSFTHCALWAENKHGELKWIYDLGSMTACKLIAFKKAEGPYPKELRRTDIVFQSDDKRIFALRASNGNITAVRSEIFETEQR